MATIIVDGVSYDVKDGQNLLQACLSVGINLPYFCWHPALGSVGACRQCAVKVFRDEKDTRGRIQMACMTPAADGTRLAVDDAQARQFRASVIEWLMESHPHDCPVCDEGGECHLQDMTVMVGHNYRRYRASKRTWHNQDLGPFVTHEMNRCIQCYRCVRYYRDYAGGRDLDAFGLRNLVYFGREKDGVLESEFSGNLVEVCPTGVFTDKTLARHYTRKWDLQTAPSVCVHCGVGCNTIPGERYGLLRRIRNRYNGAVNGYFLCDRGRYGYEFVNSERRIRRPMLRSERAGDLQAVEHDDLLAYAGSVLNSGAAVIGIGSPRASLEANFALRSLVGASNFFAGVSAADWRCVNKVLQILRTGPAPAASLQDVRASDAVLVLGEDVTNCAPMIALGLRQSVRLQPMKKTAAQHIPSWDEQPSRSVLQDEKGPCYLLTVAPTRLDDIATRTHHAAPADLARLGYAVAHAISGAAPALAVSEDMLRLAQEIAAALLAAEQPLVVCGSSLGSDELLEAAANVAWRLIEKGRPARLALVVPECNSLGLALMGGGSLDDAFGLAEVGKVGVAIIMENDLYRRAAAGVVDSFLNAAQQAIAIDCLHSRTTDKADLVLPAATFAEGNGTLVNNEGRAQRFFQVIVPGDECRESWQWLQELAAAGGRGAPSWWTTDDVDAALAATLPAFAAVPEAAPPATLRLAGQKVARQPARYSGRTAMTADVDVSEPKPPDDSDSALAFTMEGYQGQPPAPLVPRFWAPGWNSVQAVNKYQEEIAGALRGGDAGRRLLAPATGDNAAYFAAMPAAFEPRPGELLLVPFFHVFGSEEMSAQAPAVASLAPQPYLAVNERTAAALGLAHNQVADVTIGDVRQQLQVKLVAGMPDGVGGVAVGLAGEPAQALPAGAD